MISAEVREGDALERLREMPNESVQCCVTSPPYFGLRDYGTGEWEGGEGRCDHAARSSGGGPGASTLVGTHDRDGYSSDGQFRDICGKCGARRVDQQLGLEATPDEYVARLVEVFREVRRVLRDDGTLWLNIGDSYVGSWGAQSRGDTTSGFNERWSGSAKGKQANIHASKPGPSSTHPKGTRTDPLGASYKPKDLIGIPWLLAFALRADGWYLRSDIIWAKPNPMPESVTDRPTSAHEHLFLLAKSPRYFYDADAIAERSLNAGSEVTLGPRSLSKRQADGIGAAHSGNALVDSVTVTPTRNKRNVWEIATQPYAEAHFATFPPKLVEPCVLAGTSPRACGECGAPWERVVVVERTLEAGRKELGLGYKTTGIGPVPGITRLHHDVSRETTGWQPTCSHGDGSGRSTVLDPFAGSGTVGVVCEWFARDFVGIELSPEYAEMARRRIESEGRLGRRAHRPEVPQTEALF